MSPEQARGKPLDARTDVRAFGMRTYDVTRDGRFLMVTRAENAGGAESARIVLNWFQELERLVPTHD